MTLPEEFQGAAIFTAIGSLCILIATTITDKFEIYLISWIISGFLITGVLMVLSSAILLIGFMLDLNWQEEKFAIWVMRVSVFIFFFSSITLAGSYILFLFA